MILQAVKNKTCIGCMNCVYICSRKAINIHRDCRGFDIPNIDSKKCIECGMCNQVCPQNNLLLQQQKQKAYAYVIKDKNNVFLCQSGGGSTVIGTEYYPKRWGCLWCCDRFKYDCQICESRFYDGS